MNFKKHQKSCVRRANDLAEEQFFFFVGPTSRSIIIIIEFTTKVFEWHFYVYYEIYIIVKRGEQKKRAQLGRYKIYIRQEARERKKREQARKTKRRKTSSQQFSFMIYSSCHLDCVEKGFQEFL